LNPREKEKVMNPDRWAGAFLAGFTLAIGIENVVYNGWTTWDGVPFGMALFFTLIHVSRNKSP